MKNIAVSIIFLLLMAQSWAQTNDRGVVVSGKSKDTSGFNGNTYAVIVGVSNYKYIKPLSFADQDAILFKEFLQSKAGGNIKNDNILLILNHDADASTQPRIRHWLSAVKNPRKGDRVYFYFAGHGDAIDADEYFFLLQDCDPSGDKNNYIGGMASVLQMYNIKSFIKNYLTENGVEVIFIWDACRTNELPGGENGLKTVQEGIAEKSTGELIMLSASAGEVSIENNTYAHGHGLFTYYLIDGLSGAADSPDGGGNNDGKVDISELDTWVKMRVRSDAQAKFHMNQNPKFIYNTTETMSVADTAFKEQWALQKIQGENLAVTYKQNTGRGMEPSDSVVTGLYNRFMEAVKKDSMTGFNSAEYLYGQLKDRFPKSALTDEAGFNLAMEYINLAQDKINFYLSGKDESQVLTQSFDVNETNTTISKIRVTVNQNFNTHGTYLKRAITLLNGYKEIDTSYLRQLQSKADFLLAYSFYDNEGVITDLSQAMNLAKTAYSIKPGAAYNNHLLGLLYSYKKNYDSSYFYENNALKLAPNWGKVLRSIGNNYYDQGYYYKAENYYQQAISANPEDKYSYNFWGICLLQLQKSDSAEIIFSKAIQLDSNYCDGLNNLGIALENKAFDRYIHNSINQNLDFALNKTYLTDKIYHDSLYRYFRKAIHVNANYKYGYFNLGYLFSTKKEYDSAKVYYRLAISVDPAYGEAYVGIGNALRDQKQYDSAKFFYKKALDLNSRYVTAYNGLEKLYEDRALYDSALPYARKIVELVPENIYYNLSLGNIFNMQKKLDSTKIYYQRAIDLNPNSIIAIGKMAVFYYEINRFDSAEFYTRNLLRKENKSPILDVLLGVILFKEGRYDSSATYLLRSLELGPHSNAGALPVLLPFASYFTQQKKYDLTIDIYGRLLKLDSLTSPAMLDSTQKRQTNYYVGLSYLMTGDLSSAIRYYSKAGDIEGYYYDLACKFSLNNDSANALKNLELSFKKGYKNYEHIQEDTDLTNIRNTSGYLQLLKLYFPGKEK